MLFLTEFTKLLSLPLSKIVSNMISYQLLK